LWLGNIANKAPFFGKRLDAFVSETTTEYSVPVPVQRNFIRNHADRDSTQHAD